MKKPKCPWPRPVSILSDASKVWMVIDRHTRLRIDHLTRREAEFLEDLINGDTRKPERSKR